jgi:hydrogenase expression/formation protein HypC
MCLAVPGRILSLDVGDLRMGRVDFGGIVKEISLAYVPEALVGDYVIVHAGFAISRLDEEEARKTLETFRELGEILENGEASG